MKHLLLLASLVVSAGCLDQAPQPQVGQSSDELTSTGDGPRTNVTCQRIWECDPICGRYQDGVLVWFPTNVLHEECDDGTDRVIQQHACFTEDCY